MRTAPLLSSLLLLAACSGDDDGTSPSPTNTDMGADSGTPSGLPDLTVTVSTASPTIIEGTAPSGVLGGSVLATTDGSGAVEGIATGSTARLVGLAEGLTYELVFRDRGGSAVATGSYRVPSRPTALPAFDVTAEDDHNLAGGAVVTPIIQPDGRWLVAFDDQGRYLFWYDLGH